MHAANCLVLTTSTQSCEPRRDLLTQLMQLNCNWLQHKRLWELLAAFTCIRRQLTESHSWNSFLTGTEILTGSYGDVATCLCVCAHSWVCAWLAKWKEMCIWVMSSFLNPHFLFRYLHCDPPSLLPASAHSASPRPRLTSVLSCSSICIRNRIWGTMLSYHRSQSGREWERMKDRVHFGSQEMEKLEERNQGVGKIRRRKVVLFILGSFISWFGTPDRSSIVALIGLTIGSR